MRGVSWVVLTLIALPCTPAHADQWLTPYPRGHHSRGSSYLVEIFPPGARHNPVEDHRSYAYLYRMGYPGREWRSSAEPVWEGALVGVPVDAVVTRQGQVVTFDEWAKAGFENAVVVYGADGKLVRAWSLDELLEVIDFPATRSTSSRWWRKGAAHWVWEGKLVMGLGARPFLVFDLGDGSVAGYATEDRVPGYAAMLEDLNAPVSTEWELDLRFSSVTDLRVAADEASP